MPDIDFNHQQGLMSRESLSANQGMLFVFKEEDKHIFWMKNMQFPLDIIWISGDKRITEIMRNAQPCGNTPCANLKPRGKARYVLEVNAGFTASHRLKIGDRAEF